MNFKDLPTPHNLDAQIKYYLEWWKKNKPQGKYGV